MEFPDLGANCTVSFCKQLDFLPIKCDACSNIFCKDHFSYSNHNCQKAYMKDFQIPICPICNQTVILKRGELPDIKVNEHIESTCKDNRAITKRNKIYKNKCSLSGCKNNELVPIICSQCNLNFCLKHRHYVDHQCKPINKSSGTIKRISKANEVAIRRLSINKVNFLQGNISEDEALAKALQNSMVESNDVKKEKCIVS